VTETITATRRELEARRSALVAELGRLEKEEKRIAGERQNLLTAITQGGPGVTPVWDQLFLAEQARIIQVLVEAVTYDTSSGEVAITFRPGGVRKLAKEEATEAE
jgi:hypothetical protein